MSPGPRPQAILRARVAARTGSRPVRSAKPGGRLDERPASGSLGLLPSGSDPVGEGYVHRQPPKPIMEPRTANYNRPIPKRVSKVRTAPTRRATKSTRAGLGGLWMSAVAGGLPPPAAAPAAAMPIAPATPATAPAAGLFDLALPNTERLEGVQRTTGGGRGCLGRAVENESAHSGARQGEEHLAVHSELPKILLAPDRRSPGPAAGASLRPRWAAGRFWSLICPEVGMIAPAR